MGVGQAAVDKVSKGLRKGFQFLFGHVPTGRGTNFHFSQQIFILSREGLAGGPADDNFLPGKTSYATQWACRSPT